VWEVFVLPVFCGPALEFKSTEILEGNKSESGNGAVLGLSSSSAGTVLEVTKCPVQVIWGASISWHEIQA
jgi:hypothetical protein